MYVSAVSAFLACLGLFIISASMLVLAVLVHAAEKLWKKMPQVRKLRMPSFGSNAPLCDARRCRCIVQARPTPSTGATGVPKDDISLGMNEAQMLLRLLQHIEGEKVAYEHKIDEYERKIDGLQRSLEGQMHEPQHAGELRDNMVSKVEHFDQDVAHTVASLKRDGQISLPPPRGTPPRLKPQSYKPPALPGSSQNHNWKFY
jgi:hypothetical protein